MLKWIGAILLLGTTTWAGFDYSRRLKLRPKQIRQLKNALQILEAEITYSQTPLYEAFHVIAAQIPAPSNALFKQLGKQVKEDRGNLQEIWAQCVKKHVQSTSLGMKEEEILLQFGRTLGQHDMLQQEKQIQLAAAYLDRELEEARTEEEKYGKMAKTLGFLGGVFIVLMFI